MNAAGRLGLRAIAALGLLAALLIGVSVPWGRMAPLGHWPGEALADDSGLTDPFLGQPDAIAEGDELYHSKCIGCHGLKGGRGPNLFATKLTDDQFLEVVINGRQGTLMPAWGFRLSPDDVWKIHASSGRIPTGSASELRRLNPRDTSSSRRKPGSRVARGLPVALDPGFRRGDR